jgi:hypothetical protein
MTSFQRTLLRVRRRAVYCYELLLYALLVAMALGVAWSASPASEDGYCGKSHSSTAVITR